MNVLEKLIIQYLNLSFESQVSLGSLIVSGASLLGGLIAYIVKSVKEYKNKIEEMRPNVFISYERQRRYTLLQEKLVLKNYGKTAAWIEEIRINPPFEHNGDDDFKANNFTKIKDFPLAPGQEISGIIGVLGANDDLFKKTKRSYYIKYKAEGNKRKYITEYTVDEEGYPALVRTDETEDVMKIKSALVDIKKSVDKLDRKKKKKRTLL